MREMQAGNTRAHVDHNSVPLALSVYGLSACESYQEKALLSRTRGEQEGRTLLLHVGKEKEVESRWGKFRIPTVFHTMSFEGTRLAVDFSQNKMA